MRLWLCMAAALLLPVATPAAGRTAHDTAGMEAAISADEIAAASAIPDAFFTRLRAGSSAVAIGEAFAGTMMEYQTTQLQGLIDYVDTLTDHYGPVIGWELGSQEMFTNRLVRQTYLAFTDNGPFVMTFDLYRRPTGWMLLRINLHDRTHELFRQGNLPDTDSE